MDYTKYNGESKGVCLYVPNTFKIGTYDEERSETLIGGKEVGGGEYPNRRQLEVSIPSCRLFGEGWCRSGEFQRRSGHTPTMNIDKSKEIMKSLSGRVREIENVYVEGMRIDGVIPNYSFMRTYFLVRDPRDFSFEVDADDLEKLMRKCTVSNSVIMEPCRLAFTSCGFPVLVTKGIEESEEYSKLVITEDFIKRLNAEKEYLKKEELEVGKVYVMDDGKGKESRVAYLGTKEMWTSTTAIKNFFSSEFVTNSLEMEYRCGKPRAKNFSNRYYSSYYINRNENPWENGFWNNTWKSLGNVGKVHVFLKFCDKYSDRNLKCPKLWVDGYMPAEFNDYSFSFVDNLVLLKSLGKKILREAKDQTLGMRVCESPKGKKISNRTWSQHGKIDEYQGSYDKDSLVSALDKWIGVSEAAMAKYFELFPPNDPHVDYWKDKYDSDPLVLQNGGY